MIGEVNKILLIGGRNRHLGGDLVADLRLAHSLQKEGVDVQLNTTAPTGFDSETNSWLRLSTTSLNSVLLTPKSDLPDILHSSGVWRKECILAHVIAKQVNIPHIISTHGMVTPWALSQKRFKKAVAWSLYQKKILENSSLLHATSIEEVNQIRSVGIKNTIAVAPLVIPKTAVNLDSKNSGDRIACFVGRIHPVKGLGPLLEAWAMIRPLNWRLVIAGPDQDGYQQVLEKKIQKLRIQNVVKFVGPVTGSERHTLVTSSELFVSPSVTENFGIAIGEALEVGCPILTTSTTPWVKHKKDDIGWFESLTSWDLANALYEATTMDEAALREKGARGRQLIHDQYSEKKVANTMLELYALAQGRDYGSSLLVDYY